MAPPNLMIAFRHHHHEDGAISFAEGDINVQRLLREYAAAGRIK
jgi:hypothetical protein